MRVDTIFHSLTSTTYSNNMSSKRVTDFFKPKVSKSSEGVTTNLQNASVKQENDQHLNEKQNEESIIKERKKTFRFTKTLRFSENKNRGSRSIVSATLVQRFSKTLILNTYTINSPISGQLRCKEFCLLIRSACYLENRQTFCACFWSIKDSWLLFSN